MRKRKCANCGIEFSYNVILHRKYCSQRCYHKHKGNLYLRKFYAKKDFPSKEEAEEYDRSFDRLWTPTGRKFEDFL